MVSRSEPEPWAPSSATVPKVRKLPGIPGSGPMSDPEVRSIALIPPGRYGPKLIGILTDAVGAVELALLTTIKQLGCAASQVPVPTVPVTI